MALKKARKESLSYNEVEDYATIYDPTKGYDPVAHCCIHYKDQLNVTNHTRSGAMKVSRFLNICDCPVYDITNTEFIIGLHKGNILARGGKLIRE